MGPAVKNPLLKLTRLTQSGPFQSRIPTADTSTCEKKNIKLNYFTITVRQTFNWLRNNLKLYVIYMRDINRSHTLSG